EVKAHLNFEGCSRRNSNIQEVSQHSESRTPNVRGEHGRGRRSERFRSVSGSLEPTSVFSKIRRGRSESSRYRLRPEVKNQIVSATAPLIGFAEKFMANGADIATSENRGCGTFDFYMDELWCHKVTISMQWDHRKARSQENLGSPVNRSWNVKIPSYRRNTHTVKQQDHPTRMHDGLRIVLIERGDGFTSIKQRRHDLSSDGIKKLMTVSKRNRLESDLEDSIGDGVATITGRHRDDFSIYTKPNLGF
nr:hypothetical protein [Tanacetum cinerariifolium]